MLQGERVVPAARLQITVFLSRHSQLFINDCVNS
jgi:hypothetical protein